MEKIKSKGTISENRKSGFYAQLQRDKIWEKLNDICLRVDVYQIAKENKLLPKKFTKKDYYYRGGILLSHLSNLIYEKKELGNLFFENQNK